MNKSLEYIKKRLTSPGTKLEDRDISKAMVFPLTKFLQLKENEPIDAHYMFSNSDEQGKGMVHLIYNPNADFEYFTSVVSTHDGTLLFVEESIKRCIDNVLHLQTYNVKKGFPKMLNGAEFMFTMGDVVVINECDSKFAPKEKPWMQERTTVMIPLIYDFKEKET